MAILTYAATAVFCLLIGILIGLFTFRIKSRWCPTCGGDTITIAQKLRAELRENGQS